MRSPSRWRTAQRGEQCVPQQSAKHPLRLPGQVQGKRCCWVDTDRLHSQDPPEQMPVPPHQTPFPPLPPPLPPAERVVNCRLCSQSTSSNTLALADSAGPTCVVENPPPHTHACGRQAVDCPRSGTPASCPSAAQRHTLPLPPPVLPTALLVLIAPCYTSAIKGSALRLQLLLPPQVLLLMLLLLGLAVYLDSATTLCFLA